MLSLTCSDADSDRPPWSRCPSAVSAVSDPGDAWWSSDCHELTTDVISILSRRASRCVYTIRYDTRCYFSMHSKADMNQLNLPHRNDNYKMCKTEKVKMDMLRSNSKSLGNHVVSPEEEKERLQWEGFAEKEGFKPGMEE